MTNESTERLEQWLVKFRAAGVEFARAAAEYEMLEEMRKVVRASLMKEAEMNGVTAIAAQERDALASPEYIDHLRKLHDARMEYEVARTRLEARRLQFSGRQTINANERVEARAYATT